MRLFNFVLLSFLLLVPIRYFQNFGPGGIFCDYAPSLDPRKKTTDVNENYMAACCYKKKDREEPIQEKTEPVPVNFRYEPIKADNCVAGGEEKEDFGRDDFGDDPYERINEGGVKAYSKRPKTMERPSPKSADKIVKVEFAKAEFPCAKRRNVMSAECEQCELQVKANGDGVMLRCRDCREVPSNEISFPPGSNRKIIRLP